MLARVGSLAPAGVRGTIAAGEETGEETGTVAREHDEIRERFAPRYAAPVHDVHRAVERAVIGADWGANGYTTRAQTDELGALLGLAPGQRLLDVGAGRGWPGLYLAARTGCAVVLADLPLEGLAVAWSRAIAEGLAERVRVVAASAADLPLRPRSVDAVVHTDVLC